MVKLILVTALLVAAASCLPAEESTTSSHALERRQIGGFGGGLVSNQQFSSQTVTVTTVQQSFSSVQSQLSSLLNIFQQAQINQQIVFQQLNQIFLQVSQSFSIFNQVQWGANFFGQNSFSSIIYQVVSSVVSVFTSCQQTFGQTFTSWFSQVSFAQQFELSFLGFLRRCDNLGFDFASSFSSNVLILLRQLGFVQLTRFVTTTYTTTTTTSSSSVAGGGGFLLKSKKHKHKDA